MSTHRLQQQLSAYLDGELVPDEIAEVRRHLTDCPSCQEELEGLRLVKTALAGLKQPELPADFAAGVWARIERSPAQAVTRWAGPWAWLRRPALAAAAVALAIVLAAVPLVRGHLGRLRAAEVSPDLFIRTYMPSAAEDPLIDRAFLTLVTTDANLKLVGDEPRGDRR